MKEKSCQRCGSKFICMHDEDITKCQCASVKLDEKQLALIKSQYSDCLCRDCLELFSKID